MSRLIDLTGKKFGRLTVIERGEGRYGGSAFWVCRCDCGNTVTVDGANLRSGNSTSCGCFKREHPARLRHGMSKTKLYGIWRAMKDRCQNPHTKFYKNYGGRGIAVCDEWKSPEKFFEWAKENGYAKGMTIDRIDVNGDYCPENCRWVSMEQQGNNKRNNVLFELDGKTQTLAQWCTELDCNYKTVYKRVFVLGWDFERAVKEPIQTNKRNKKAGVKKGNG